MIRIVSGLFLFLLLAPPADAAPKNDVDQAASQLQQTIKDIPGVKVTTVGNVILLEGTVAQADQMERLSRIVDGLQDLSGSGGKIAVRNIAVISQQAREKLAQEIQRDIGAAGITVRFLKETIFLEGVAENDFQADRAVEIARGHLRTGTPELRRPSSEPVKGGKVVTFAHHPAWGDVNIVDMLRVAPRKPRR